MRYTPVGRKTASFYSLYEMLAAAKRSGGRLLLSHFVYQYSGFGTLRPALDVVDAARAKGMDVWMDSGMYTDWATYAGTATFDEQTIKDNSLRFGRYGRRHGQVYGHAPETGSCTSFCATNIRTSPSSAIPASRTRSTRRCKSPMP